MTRSTGSKRVGSGSADRSTRQSSEMMSLRRRRPVIFWVVILAALAMVLTTFASFISAIG